VAHLGRQRRRGVELAVRVQQLHSEAGRLAREAGVTRGARQNREIVPPDRREQPVAIEERDLRERAAGEHGGLAQPRLERERRLGMPLRGRDVAEHQPGDRRRP